MQPTWSFLEEICKVFVKPKKKKVVVIWNFQLWVSKFEIFNFNDFSQLKVKKHEVVMAWSKISFMDHTCKLHQPG